MKNTALKKSDSLILKGVAIIMLMWYHCFLKGRFEDYGIRFDPLDLSQVADITSYFKICVAIFAFVSGYGLCVSIANNKENISKWVRKRVVSTFSGYWIVVILCWIITYFADRRPVTIYFKSSVSAGIMNMLTDLAGLTAINGEGPKYIGTWWYMTAALLFIVFTPLIFDLIKKCGWLVALIICFAFGRVMGEFPGGMHWLTFIMVYVLGMIFAEYDLFQKISDFRFVKSLKFDPVKFIVSVLLLYGSYKVYVRIDVKQYWEIKYNLIPVMLIIFIYLYIAKIPLINKVLAFLGKHSMNIFLIHNFFRTYYVHDFIYSFSFGIVVVLVLLLMSLGVSLVLEGMKKLIHYNAFMNKIFRL